MVSEDAERLTQRLKNENFREQLVKAFHNADGKTTDRHLTAENFPANVNYTAHWIDNHLVAEVTSVSVQRHESILMLHGGGFVIPAGKNFVTVGMQFVREGYTVWFADYPLVQSYPSSYLREWLLRAYALVTANKQNTFLFGDSAGANLAFRLLIDIRDNGLQRPLATELFSLGPDLTLASDVLRHQVNQDVVLDRQGLLQVFGDVFDEDMNQYYSFSLQDDYTNIGNIRLDTGEHELFTPDTAELSNHLETTGTHVELVVHTEMMHDFIMWPQLPESQATMTDILSFFRQSKN